MQRAVVHDPPGRRAVLRFVLALGWLSLLGCAATGRPPAPGEPPRTRHARVAALVETFLDSLNTLDLERLLRLFAPGCTAFLPLPEEPLRLEGAEAVRHAFAEFFNQVRSAGAGPRYMNLKAEEVRIQEAGRTVVVTFQLKGPHVISRRTLVLTEVRGELRILHLHGSNIRLEPAAPADSPPAGR